MGFKNMKRDDHGHVISNNETDGQECEHASGKADKVEDQKYNREMQAAQNQNADMSEAFDDDYEEEFNDFEFTDKQISTAKEYQAKTLEDEGKVDDAKAVREMSNIEFKSEMRDSLGNEGFKELIEEANSDEIIAQIGDDESQEEYLERIKPETDKFVKNMEAAGYELDKEQYGVKKKDAEYEQRLNKMLERHPEYLEKYGSRENIIQMMKEMDGVNDTFKKPATMKKLDNKYGRVQYNKLEEVTNDIIDNVLNELGPDAYDENDQLDINNNELLDFISDYFNGTVTKATIRRVLKDINEYNAEV